MDGYVKDVEELESDEKIVKMIRDWFKDSKAHYSEWRTNAREDFKFRAGDQWDEEDKTKLESENRPAIVFNRVAPVINSVSGFESSNRQEVRYRPRTLDDSGINDVYTQAAKFFRDECDAEDEESDSFKDAITCGMGWTETFVDYEDDPEGLIKTERVSPLEMYPDCKATKQNLADARYHIRLREFAEEDFNTYWPGVEVSGEEGDSDDQSDPSKSYAGDDYAHASKGHNTKTGKYYVLHCQYWLREVYYRAVDPLTGQSVELDEERYKTLSAVAEFEAVKLTRKKFKQAFVCGQTLLDQSDGPCQGHFGFQCITGFRDEIKRVWMGLMAAMKDPQRWANKFLSQFQDIVNSNAKGGVFVESGYLVDPKKAENQWNNPSSMILLKEGGINKIKERQMSVFPASVDRLLEIAVASTRDVTGINLEFLGMANRDQSGVLEAERKRAVLVVLSDLFNSLRRYRKMQGRVLLYFIQNYIPEGRIIRMVGEDGIKYAPLIQDKSVVQYDVIVDTAPNSPNMKSEAWNSLQNILPAMIKAGIPVPPEVVMLMPLPVSIAEKWMEYIKQNSQPSPEQQEKQQLDLAQQQAEIANEQSGTALNQAKTQSELASIQTDAARVQLEAIDRQIDDAKTAADIMSPGGGGVV